MNKDADHRKVFKFNDIGSVAPIRQKCPKGQTNESKWSQASSGPGPKWGQVCLRANGVQVGPGPRVPKWAQGPSVLTAQAGSRIIKSFRGEFVGKVACAVN